jgi:hypothetical protein
MNLLQNSILSRHLSSPIGSGSTRGTALPKLDFGVPSVLSALSQNDDDTGMVIYVNSRGVVYGKLDDYHRLVRLAAEMAEAAVLGQESANAWWNSFVHRIVDDYDRLVERPTEMVMDEVTTVVHEHQKLLWKAMSDARCDAGIAGVMVAHEQDYHSRIAALREMAEDEGFTVAEASIKDLWIFFSTLSPSQKAELAVNPNENLRAIWDDDHGNHVGIQFRGAGVLQYVIFKGPTDSPERIYDAGRGDIEVVRQLVKDFDLENLLGIYGV